MVRVHGLRLRLDEDEVAEKCARLLGLPAGRILEILIRKKSVDARDKENILLVYTVDLRLSAEDEHRLFAAKPGTAARRGGRPAGAARFERLNGAKPSDSAEGAAGRPAENAGLPVTAGGTAKNAQTPVRPRAGGRGGQRFVVAGAGPAGLFAALALARAGARPLVVERGRTAAERARDVEKFVREGVLDTESNIQFGEGGAGTFSDGKLWTNIRDPRCFLVLEELAAAGAPPEILYQAKPHIGTDHLRRVVENLRAEILRHGGEFRFETRLADVRSEEGSLLAVDLVRRGGGRDEAAESIRPAALIAAVGHSARDVFELFHRRGVPLAAKPFSVGLRVEHPQELIDRAQYGRFAGHPRLGPADYKLVYHAANGRSVYTFCMCPGGWVVPAASEAGGVVTNGMSEFARAGANANSALLVGIDPGDFGGEGPLSGVAFQRLWERTAFLRGGGDYSAPVQRVGDFLAGSPSTGPGEVLPTYKPGVRYGDAAACLPDFAAAAIREALPVLGRVLRGFDHPDAILTAVESRSSSPVRVLRGEDGESPLRRLFPAGEGAGYAGGIVSAAVDGLRAAERALAAYG